MLSRGFYDALAIWPTAAWPVLFSSAFYAFIRLCQASERRHGFSVLTLRSGAGPLACMVYVPVAALFEVAIHLYLLWVVGWLYALVLIPIYVFGWMVLPAVLDDLGLALVALPVLHLGLAAAFLVLLGFADLAPLRALNAELYALLTGLPAAL